MARVIVIGDVHGCAGELDRLLDVVKPEACDHVVFVGDLVDKGPDTPGVVRQARLLGEACRVTLVIGNHEEKHARFRSHLADGQGRQNKMKGVVEMTAITNALSDADLAFLESAVLWERLPLHGAVVIHGGLPPSIQSLPADHLRAALHDGARWGSGHARDKYGPLVRVRHVNQGGYMIPLGQEGPGDPYWAETYDGREGLVLFGHEAFVRETEPKRFPYALGLDLGCAYGNVLAAAILDDARPGVVSSVNVKAAAKYAVSYAE